MSTEQAENTNVTEKAGQQQQPGEVNGKAKHDSNSSRKERPQKRGGGGRYEPYGNVNKRYRVFVSNIPYDVKWQALKDLMKEKGKVFGKGIDSVSFGHEKKQHPGSFCLTTEALEGFWEFVQKLKLYNVARDLVRVIWNKGFGRGPSHLSVN